MPRQTSPIEATIIDYLHRNGGEGTRQALIDGVALTAEYAESSIRAALVRLARDGALEYDGALFTIDYDATEGWPE